METSYSHYFGENLSNGRSLKSVIVSNISEYFSQRRKSWQLCYSRYFDWQAGIHQLCYRTIWIIAGGESRAGVYYTGVTRTIAHKLFETQPFGSTADLFVDFRREPQWGGSDYKPGYLALRFTYFFESKLTASLILKPANGVFSLVLTLSTICELFFVNRVSAVYIFTK